jgi:hypothetical protein
MPIIFNNGLTTAKQFLKMDKLFLIIIEHCLMPGSQFMKAGTAQADFGILDLLLMYNGI